MRLCAFLLLVFAALSEGHAQVVYSYAPNPATASDVVRLRIDIHRCFDEQFVVVVDASARTVTARFDGDDTLCDDTVPANTVTPRFVDIGQLAAGTYDARVVGCIVGTDVCQTVHGESLVVAGLSATRSMVPTLSPHSLLLLALTALCLGVRAARE